MAWPAEYLYLGDGLAIGFRSLNQASDMNQLSTQSHLSAAGFLGIEIVLYWKEGLWLN
jgi:hypothetical protein